MKTMMEWLEKTQEPNISVTSREPVCKTRHALNCRSHFFRTLLAGFFVRYIPEQKNNNERHSLPR